MTSAKPRDYPTNFVSYMQRAKNFNKICSTIFVQRLSKIITGDKTWVYGYDLETKYCYYVDVSRNILGCSITVYNQLLVSIGIVEYMYSDSKNSK